MSFNATVALQQLAQANNPMNRMKAMIGAKDFLQDAENCWVRFKFAAKAINKANMVKITLTPSDLYKVEFIRQQRKLNKEVSIPEAGIKIYDDVFTAISEIDGLFAEDLKSYFEKETGL